MAEKDGKKRKRRSNGEETSNKKLATGAANASAGKIKVTYSDDDSLRPVLVSTPGLTPPSIPFELYVKARSANQASGTPKPGTHHVLLHSSKHPRLDYTAAPAVSDQYLSHHIAVFDPATNDLQITLTILVCEACRVRPLR